MTLCNSLFVYFMFCLCQIEICTLRRQRDNFNKVKNNDKRVYLSNVIRVALFIHIRSLLVYKTIENFISRRKEMARPSVRRHKNEALKVIFLYKSMQQK